MLTLTRHSFVLTGAGHDRDGWPLHRWDLAFRVTAPTREQALDFLDTLEDDTNGNCPVTDRAPIRDHTGEGYDVRIQTHPLRGKPERSLAAILLTDHATKDQP